ncbi:MAG: hypothetical protein GDA49_00260 [Rhodospirillales bacterium]|nr:hypothetical protein [Rhodospirillales bacterium]
MAMTHKERILRFVRPDLVPHHTLFLYQRHTGQQDAKRRPAPAGRSA